MIKLIVAASENNVIGVKNDLPWHLPDDMTFFKKITQGSVVIMGRKNFLSIPPKFRPLPNRTNIILSKKTNFSAENCITASSLEEGIKLAKKQSHSDIFIIGGGLVYEYALKKDLVDIIYLTRVHASIDGDVYFPKLNNFHWKESILSRKSKDEKHKYAFTIFKLERLRG